MEVMILVIGIVLCIFSLVIKTKRWKLDTITKFNFKLNKLSKTFKNLIFVDNIKLWIIM